MFEMVQQMSKGSNLNMIQPLEEWRQGYMAQPSSQGSLAGKGTGVLCAIMINQLLSLLHSQCAQDLCGTLRPHQAVAH